MIMFARSILADFGEKNLLSLKDSIGVLKGARLAALPYQEGIVSFLFFWSFMLVKEGKCI